MARRGGKQSEPRALVAAATRLKLNDKRLVKRQAARRQAWQEDAWEYFDLVGFVKQALWLIGNQIAKTRLFVAVDDPNDADGDPIPATDASSGVPADVAAQAEAELARLKGATGGLSEILRELDMNLEVAGEGYIIGRAARPEVLALDGTVKEEATDETWSVCSTSEVEVTSGGVMKVVDDDDKPKPLDENLDTAIRFWIPHPRRSHRPDSAMRGELEDLETLLILSRQRRAEGKSRLPSGLLLIDADVTASSVVKSEQDDGENSGTGDPVLDAIADAIADAIEDESSAAGLAPVALRVTTPVGKSVVDMVAKVDLSRTSDQWLDHRIAALVESVARGLDLPVESVMGHQRTTFANAKQIDEDKFYDHIEPRLLLIVDLLTVAFLRPQLVADDASGVAAPAAAVEWAPKLYVWYDASALLSKPDLGASADDAFDRNAISAASYRAAKGYGDDDAPDALELLIREGLGRGQLNADVTKALLDLLGVPLDVQPLPSDSSPSQASMSVQQREFLSLASLLIEAERRSNIVAAVAHEDLQPTRSPSTHTHVPRAALARAAVDNAGRRLMDIDRELRTRLLVLAHAEMQAALTTAGNRAKNKLTEARALTAKVRGVQVLLTLGRGLVAAGGVTDDELLADAFDSMEASFMAWGATAQHDALELASTLGTGFSIEQRAQYELRQAEDLVEAWAWLKGQLVTLASLRMFDPSPEATLGEFDASLSVPSSMIRQAITRAGGMIGVQTSNGKDAWVALRNGGSEPAGGIGTGEVIRDALSAGGSMVEGYQWVYGPAARTHPFDEHVALDGTVVENFDDNSLDASDSWTQFGYYFPGDHAGCLCDVEPIIVDASTLA